MCSSLYAFEIPEGTEGRIQEGGRKQHADQITG